MKRKKHILLAIPAVGNTVATAVAQFTTLAVRYNGEKKCPWKFSVAYLLDVRPTEYARNRLITLAIDQKDVDAIWFIDSDMIPTPNSFEMLKLWDKADIISGLCPIFSNGDLARPSFHYNFYNYVPGHKDGRNFMPLPIMSDKPIQVEGAGTACMIIKKKVYKDPKMWLQPKRVNGVVPLFRWLKNGAGETTGTDDLDFCKRARGRGYRLFAHQGVQWGHIKSVDLNWMIHKLHATQTTKRFEERIPTLNDWNGIAIKNKGQFPIESVRQQCPSIRRTRPAGKSARDGVNRANRGEVTGRHNKRSLGHGQNSQTV